MRSTLITLALAFAATTASAAKPDYPVAKRATSLPPSADLSYAVKGSNHGFPLAGTGTIAWRQGEGSYSLHSEARSSLFGKVLEQRSEGTLDGYGLAPATFYEKRFRKEPTTTRFERDTRRIEFEDGKTSYAIRGGEQDRSSVTFQLAILARATPDKFTPGSEWTFFVAGRRDGEPWTFRVVGSETLENPTLGEQKVLHFSRKQVGGHEQRVDLWLAPDLDWYPARILLKEEDGDSFEQVLEKVNRK
ncbi:DUF3108 domain-containing protein [Duganella sp. Root336D2]|uniref:DUF3108 domain-containing protein n=1 Tax=Duganella sp. Root336D2 TaxID=1736518 RepID=UPI000700BEF0|nr:DUF3108 domain-containing protein [Duganella sp. Root336D2]KQV44802.1 hypothetical protein ASD07_19835 [Duganella sp. Root336D2]